MMNKFLFWLAVTGWSFSVTVHIISIYGINVENAVPYWWVLHIGVFAVWLPTVLKLKKDKKLQEYQDSDVSSKLNPFKALKIMFRNTPKWMQVAATAGFIYAFINFNLSHHEGSPTIINGEYVLVNHDKTPKHLTLQEYNHYKAAVEKDFSAGLILFYGVATAVLYPFAKKEEEPDHNV